MLSCLSTHTQYVCVFVCRESMWCVPPALAAFKNLTKPLRKSDKQQVNTLCILCTAISVPLFLHLAKKCASLKIAALKFTFLLNNDKIYDV